MAADSRIQDADDYGTKQQCLAIAMHLLSDLDRNLVFPYAEAIVNASWHLMQHALPLMVKHEVRTSLFCLTELLHLVDSCLPSLLYVHGGVIRRKEKGVYMMQIEVDEEDALAAGAADPDDGDLLTLEAIVAQLFELLLMLVSSATYQVRTSNYCRHVVGSAR